MSNNQINAENANKCTKHNPKSHKSGTDKMPADQGFCKYREISQVAKIYQKNRKKYDNRHLM
jgi:hypothetical protein